jgi:hypothetical protein
VDAADRGVEAELADRDAHATDALVAEAEDALAIGDDDDVHVLLRAVAEDFAEPVPVFPGQEQTAWPPVDRAEAEAGLPDRRCVDDGQHLLQVLGDEVVEEDLVGVLQLPQVDVPVEWLVVAEERRVGAVGLLLEGLHGGRQQPVETEFGAFWSAEGRALVEQRVGEDRGAVGLGVFETVGHHWSNADVTVVECCGDWPWPGRASCPHLR